MLSTLHPSKLLHLKDVLLLLARHGRSDLVRQAGRDLDLRDLELADEGQAEAEQLAEDLERLGPTYVKLGQLLSTRSDLLPEAYLDALARLQDDVEPFGFEEVEEIVETELGVRISRAFASFEREPLAAASLGQVHRATLRDGRPVAVKVQRPGVRERVARDLDALDDLARLLDKHTKAGRRHGFRGILAEFRATITEELDYRKEASNLTTFRSNLESFEHLVVPAAIDDLTTSRVLTMEFVAGTQIAKLSPVVHLDLDGAELADELSRAYLHQVLVDGVFHADPHPGNVLLTRDRRIALIDLGMIGRVRPEMRQALLRMILAVSEGDGEQAAAIAIEIGSQREESFDAESFVARIADLVASEQHSRLEEIEIGKVLLAVYRAAGRCGVRLPAELALLGKTFLNLEQIGRRLDPSFNPAQSIRRNAGELTSRQVWDSTTPARLLSALLDSRELVQEGPGRLNRIMEHLADNRLKLDIDAPDERALVVGMQKISNRITSGLIVAAMIIGAGLLMRVETTFKLFGYPGLAMLFFLGAGVGGLGLMYSILRNDHELRRQ